MDHRDSLEDLEHQENHDSQGKDHQDKQNHQVKLLHQENHYSVRLSRSARISWGTNITRAAWSTSMKRASGLLFSLLILLTFCSQLEHL